MGPTTSCATSRCATCGSARPASNPPMPDASSRSTRPPPRTSDTAVPPWRPPIVPRPRPVCVCRMAAVWFFRAGLVARLVPLPDVFPVVEEFPQRAGVGKGGGHRSSILLLRTWYGRPRSIRGVAHRQATDSGRARAPSAGSGRVSAVGAETRVPMWGIADRGRGSLHDIPVPGEAEGSAATSSGGEAPCPRSIPEIRPGLVPLGPVRGKSAPHARNP